MLLNGLKNSSNLTSFLTHIDVPSQSCTFSPSILRDMGMRQNKKKAGVVNNSILVSIPAFNKAEIR